MPAGSDRLSARRVILTTLGTDGDVFPYLALGSALRARGINVTLATSGAYADLARQRGLDFEALVSAAEIQEWFDHPDCWHPLKGGAVGARWGLKYLRRQFDALSRLADAEDTVLVAHPGVLAARIVHDRFTTPFATVLLQPWVIQSNIEPPRMARLSLPAGWPTFIGNAYWGMIDRIVDRVVGTGVNAFRQELGLPPVRRVRRWWMSPQSIIGLFPDWYGRPQPDWPAHLQLTDFPLDDGRKERELPSDVAEFLKAGTPPVAFTFGTGMQHASRVFAAGLEACSRLGVRCLILTRYPNQLPQSLPAFAHHAEFAPFRTLFPQCAAVVHHGGIGTTSQGLAAGVPQLIVPFAFDQFDNAARLKRLGVGDSVGMRRRGPTQIATVLQSLLTPEVRTRSQQVARQIGSTGLTAAAEKIEAMFTDSRRDRLVVHQVPTHQHAPHVHQAAAQTRTSSR